eukprot:TRINITY_DN6933_c0_g1_i2.p1 TRINITY_DN6933_c0_g1~~TRINITY_DN6933_c0_g1_i2.p1  ORF type:complete len:1034 (-),score=367.37 TRINITY_DN6933_c0_g1_i2:110-3211(-)
MVFQTPPNGISKHLPTSLILQQGRKKSDRATNYAEYQVLRDGSMQTMCSKDIVVGDIVRVQRGQIFPADLVTVSSNDEEGVCYIETANLDGETNLKMRRAMTATMKYKTDEQVSSIQGSVRCEPPNEHLFEFNGVFNSEMQQSNVGGMGWEGEEGAVSQTIGAESLTAKNLLLRGARLRNTQYAYGLVVYTGVDTKIFLNQQPSPSKLSTTEKRLNKYVLLIFGFQMFCCLVAAVFSGFFQDTEVRNMTYIGGLELEPVQFGIRNFFTYFILFNTMIPISLMVTLELVRLAQVKFMEMDTEMTTEFQKGEAPMIVQKSSKLRKLGGKKKATSDKQIVHMTAKTSNLNEELGQIEYIFSDKTGTLTENKMEFSKCCIQGLMFDQDTLNSALQSGDPKLKEQIEQFFLCLCLCHTAVPELDEETDELIYQAQSPDETALLKAAAEAGYVLTRKTTSTLTVTVHGEERTFDVLALIEFSSARRRMSIIARDEKGRVTLYSKGADHIMFDRLAHDSNQQMQSNTDQHLSAMAKEGLRTLVVCYREMTEQQFSEWNLMWADANNAIEGRRQKMETASDVMERDFELLGATAIEDKLQQEVPETIQYLLDCNIHVWVLTGDKQETAINIGYSSRLLVDDMELLEVPVGGTDQCGSLLNQWLKAYTNPDKPPTKPLALVIGGRSLGWALRERAPQLMQLTSVCKSVICCRVTPLEKALVVRLIKTWGKTTCLSIGDGANDVSMIQEAHVGVGIFGREGTQAARASDYAITEFRHLKTLLAKHGRWSYLRITGVIQYSFYKNIAFTFPQFWFSIYNGWTGQTLYDSYLLAAFNIFFTSFPIFVYGFIEQDLSAETLKKYPYAYRELQTGKHFNFKSMTIWMLTAIFHSVILFYTTFYVFDINDVIRADGLSVGMWTMGTLTCTYGVVTVTMKLMLNTHYWTWLQHFGFWGSLAFYVFFITVLNLTDQWSPPMFQVWNELVQQPIFYLMLILVPVMCLLPDYALAYYMRTYRPTDAQMLQHVEAAQKNGNLQETTEMTTLEG